MAYEPACSDADCLDAFEYVFGYSPRELVRTGGAVLVGPIEENNNECQPCRLRGACSSAVDTREWPTRATTEQARIAMQALILNPRWTDSRIATNIALSPSLVSDCRHRYEALSILEPVKEREAVDGRIAFSDEAKAKLAELSKPQQTEIIPEGQAALMAPLESLTISDRLPMERRPEELYLRIDCTSGGTKRNTISALNKIARRQGLKHSSDFPWEHVNTAKHVEALNHPLQPCLME